MDIFDPMDAFDPMDVFDPLEVFDTISTSGGIHLVIEHYEFYGDTVCGN